MLFPLLRRLVKSLLLIWGVLTLTFFLVHAGPGDPMDRYISPRIPPETITQIRQQFGFDQPAHVQYYKWLRQSLQGDWGYSLTQHRPVVNILAEAVPATLQLTIPVLLLNFIFGIFFGTVAAFYRNRWPDRVLSHAMLAVYCMPSFWLGLMLILIFAVKLGWLPNSNAATLFTDGMGFWNVLKDRLLHLPTAAVTARYVRENLANVMDTNFIRLAKAKGLSSRQIMACHALPHALLPLISLLGLSFPFLFGGAFLTEIIFAWPGMGRVTYDAIFARDYPVILAATALSAIFVIVGNFLADMLYKLADPRIRF